MWIVTLFLGLLFWPLTLARFSWSLTRWLFGIIFLSPVAVNLPAEAHSSVSLSTLTDISLLAILEHLPIADLLTAQCLSRRLAIIASSAARSRRSIILLDSTWSIRHLTRVFPPTMEQYFVILENSPRRVSLHTAHPAILQLSAQTKQTKAGAGHSRTSLPWQPLTTNLPALFPKVSRLYVSVQGDAPILQMLVSLVDAWPKLTRLHFCYQMVDPVIEPTAQEKAAVRALYEALLAAINGLPDTFQHLHLYIKTSDAFAHHNFTTPPLSIDLPIVAQLKNLYLRTNNLGSYDKNGLVHGLLFQHMNPPNPLTGRVLLLERFTIDTWFTEEYFLQVPIYLASRMVKLWLCGTITEANLAIYALIFRRLGAERGGSLKHLSVSYSLPLYRLVQIMEPLAKLTHLFLTSSQVEEPKMAPPGTTLQQLTSVRSLRLLHSFERHAYLEKLTLDLANHFPSILVAHLTNANLHCADCGHRWDGEWPVLGGFDPALDAQCAQVGEAYFHQNLPNLQTLLFIRRLGWAQSDTHLNIQHAPWN